MQKELSKPYGFAARAKLGQILAQTSLVTLERSIAKLREAGPLLLR